MPTDIQEPANHDSIKTSNLPSESAVSPLAYLADLLDYAVIHLKYRGRLAVTSGEQGQLDVFLRGPDNSLWHVFWRGDRWDEEILGGRLRSDPVAVSWSDSQINVFARSADNTLWHTWYDSNQWQQETLNNWLTSDPLATAWKPGRIDLFSIATDKTLRHRWWDGKWSGESSYTHPLLEKVDPPTRLKSISWGPDRIDLFTRDSENALLHLWGDGNSWNVESLGGALVSEPTVVSWGKDRIDVFAALPEKGLWQKWWDGHIWQEAELEVAKNYRLAGENLAAISWEANRIDILASNRQDYSPHFWWDGQNWHTGTVSAERFSSDLVAISPGVGRISLFGCDLNGWIAHLKWDGNQWNPDFHFPSYWPSLTPGLLSNTLHQPLADLPKQSKAVNQQVRQIRIFIEALRKSLAENSPDDKTTSKIKTYIRTAYSTLLNQMGTSYEEIQYALRLGDEGQQKILANRLGINPNHLSTLLLDPSSENLTEQVLERLFGLVATDRDPLSAGLILDDPEDQISRWDLNGIEWGRNTDIEGKIYVKLIHSPTSSTYNLYLYRDRWHKTLVASGESACAADIVNLEERFNSGLTGSIELAYQLDSEGMAIVAIPEFLSHRLEHLRVLWRAQDWSPVATTNTNPPLIDPDLITETHLRKGKIDDSVLSLWEQRRKWTNELALYFRQYDLGNSNDPLLAFDRLLTNGIFGSEVVTAELFDLFSVYRTNSLDYLLEQTLQFSPTSFDTLLSRIDNGPGVAGARREITEELYLSLHSFREIAKIWAIYKGTKSKPLDISRDLRLFIVLATTKLVASVMRVSEETIFKSRLDQLNLTEEEFSYLSAFRSLLAGGISCSDLGWSRVLEIMLQVRQRRRYATWQVEEQAVGLFMSRTNTYYKFGYRPAIDPDIIGPQDFRLPRTQSQSNATCTPYDVWLKRRNVLNSQLNELFRLTQDDGSPNLVNIYERMYQPFEYQYGGVTVKVVPWAETTKPADFPVIQADLAGGEDVRNRAKVRIETDLKLTVESFSHLVEFQAKYTHINHNSTQLITTDEWQEVCSILIQAQKVSLFPFWVEEEQKLGEQLGDVIFGPQFFWIASNEPSEKDWPSHWRASRELRQAWQETLRENSMAPLITPDCLRRVYLANIDVSIDAGNTAWILWRNRRDWIIDKLESLKKLVVATEKKWKALDIVLVGSLFEADEIVQLLAGLHTTHAAYGLDHLIQQTLNYSPDDLQIFLDRLSHLTEWVEVQKIITEVLYLNIEDLRQLMQIRTRDKGGEPVTAVEWDEFYQTLAIRSLIASLFRLANEEKDNPNRDSDLNRLGLERKALTYLARLRRWLVQGVVVTETEWINLYDILVQAQKRRHFAEWRTAERDADLILDPLYFQIPDQSSSEFDAAESTSASAWRVNWQLQRDWQDRLQARIDQESAVKVAWQEMLNATEEATLPILRTALLDVLDIPGSLTDKANWVTDNLLIDAQTGIYQMTTRASQAIETMQSLIWSVRTDQLGDSCLNVRLEADNFEEEWKWMGSYTTWRAAMLVFLYPENLLLPTLRRWQTPAFKRLVEELRANRCLDTKRAIEATSKYSAYFEDVSLLDVQATFYDGGLIMERPSNFFRFALSRKTGLDLRRKVYWSDKNNPWDVVPGLENLNSERIIGVASDSSPDLARFALLFVLSRENLRAEHKIVVTRYDLNTNTWLGDIVELELPFTLFGVTLVEKTEPPVLIFADHGSLYVRKFDAASMSWIGGDDWDSYKLKLHLPWPTLYKAVHIGNDEKYGLLICFRDFRDDKSGKLTVTLLWLPKDDHDDPVLDSIQTLPPPIFTTKGSWTGGLAGDVAPSGSGDPVLYVFYRENSGSYYCVIHAGPTSVVSNRRTVPLVGLEQIILRGANLFPYGRDNIWSFAYQLNDNRYYESRFKFQANDSFEIEKQQTQLVPTVKSPFAIIPPVQLSEVDLQLRRSQIKQAFLDNDSDAVESIVPYLEEAAYYVPIHVALQLQKSGDHLAALDWFRLVYDYGAPLEQRKIYGGLGQEISPEAVFQRSNNWLLDPLNPHAIAATRPNSFTRFTLLSLVDCLLAYADTEYTQDTSESVARARTLYTTALQLLKAKELEEKPVFWSARQKQIQATAVTSEEHQVPNVARLPLFHIPVNPVFASLRLHSTLNLYKLRNSLNIAGMQRQLEPYAVPTNVLLGLPSISTGGQIVLPGTLKLQPTPYRYSVIIERAKQLVQLAAQVEAAMLSALEKRDAELYNLLKARQDVQLAQAGIRLQDLRINEAQAEVKLAEFQQQRAQIQVKYYEDLVDEGLLGIEKTAIGFLIAAAALHTAAAVAGGIWGAATLGANLSDAFSSGAAAASTTAEILSTYANQERRKQEWKFQQKLAEQDIRIGGQQISIAEDRVSIVGQEREIAQMQAEHAKDIADFLGNKFLNAELYDWMSGVLEGVYSYFLQQATAMAKLAENQLAFERQEIPPSYIQTDYWTAPSENAIASSSDSKAPDRRGLTGSARLLRDIYQLDQYAFETNRRKLQLTKTVSLAQLAPAEFQRFRETGMMRFATPMALFDRDFPGHYLRLIKRVRTSVVALIPPVQGIHATLSTIGISRVTIGGTMFQTVPQNIGPQAVALTSPREATGLFELETQSDMLLPFEGMGVDTSWEFRMLKPANLFDYNTIADVLITIEYTALDSPTYRQQIIRELDRNFSADRPFSFRHHFADQWFDLHNPDQTQTPMMVCFRTQREDFPPNLDYLKIQHIVLYFARANKEPFDGQPLVTLQFAEQGEKEPVGGAVQLPTDGILSTRRGSAESWRSMIGQSPFEKWELTLPGMRDLFMNEEIEDILLVITYQGQTPEWPV